MFLRPYVPTSMRELLQKVLALPTAPLHEHAVIAFVKEFAAQQGLVCRADRFGNLLLHNRARGKIAMIAMAHMDHPGVEVIRSQGRVVQAWIRGGLNVQQIERAAFRFFLRDGREIVGRAHGRLKKNVLKISVAESVPLQTFGVLDLPAVRLRGDRVEARAIDNLAGTALVLAWLQSMKNARTRVMGVLTRAEEIGFCGGVHLVKTRALPRDVPIVVLETSAAAIARVTIGAGPVLRVGDRLTTFDPRIDCWMQRVALQLAKADSKFACQRALMIGGAMESSLYVMDGLMVGAIALPLANYHNQGRRAPALERISLRDWQRAHQLLCALARGPSVESSVARLRKFLMTREK